MNNVYMMDDAELASGIKLLQELIDGNVWLLEHLQTREQTAYNIGLAEAAQSLIERDEHQQKVYAAEIYRREQEYLAEQMDAYMDSERNFDGRE
jgi:hypothetical protein